MISLNSHKCRRKALFSPLQRWRNWAFKTWGDSSIITRLESGSIGISVQFYLTQRPFILYHLQLCLPESQVPHLQNKGVGSDDLPRLLTALTAWPPWLGGQWGVGKGSQAPTQQNISLKWQSTGTLCPTCMSWVPDLWREAATESHTTKDEGTANARHLKKETSSP